MDETQQRIDVLRYSVRFAFFNFIVIRSLCCFIMSVACFVRLSIFICLLLRPLTIAILRSRGHAHFVFLLYFILLFL